MKKTKYLHCIVHGDHLNNSFIIEIDIRKTIYHLKASIQHELAPAFPSIAAKDYEIFLIKVPINNTELCHLIMKKHPNIVDYLHAKHLNQPQNSIKTYFQEEFDPNYLHILVYPPGLVYSPPRNKRRLESSSPPTEETETAKRSCIDLTSHESLESETNIKTTIKLLKTPPRSVKSKKNAKKNMGSPVEDSSPSYSLSQDIHDWLNEDKENINSAYEEEKTPSTTILINENEKDLKKSFQLKPDPIRPSPKSKQSKKQENEEKPEELKPQDVVSRYDQRIKNKIQEVQNMNKNKDSSQNNKVSKKIDNRETKEKQLKQVDKKVITKENLPRKLSIQSYRQQIDNNKKACKSTVSHLNSIVSNLSMTSTPSIPLTTISTNPETKKENSKKENIMKQSNENFKFFNEYFHAEINTKNHTIVIPQPPVKFWKNAQEKLYLRKCFGKLNHDLVRRMNRAYVTKLNLKSKHYLTIIHGKKGIGMTCFAWYLIWQWFRKQHKESVHLLYQADDQCIRISKMKNEFQYEILPYNPNLTRVNSKEYIEKYQIDVMILDSCNKEELNCFLPSYQFFPTIPCVFLTTTECMNELNLLNLEKKHQKFGAFELPLWNSIEMKECAHLGIKLTSIQLDNLSTPTEEW